VLVIAVLVAIPMLGAPPQFANVLSKLTSLLLIAAVAVLLVRAVGICEHVVLMRYDLTAADNLRARKVYTQLHVISRVL
jgi:predicted membrane protein